MIQTNVNNKIFTIDSPASIQAAVNQMSSLLQKGEIIIAPTETKYGMLADASNEKALERLYEIKGRPDYMPTAVFLRSIDDIKQFGVLTDKAEKIASHFLPGPLTIVLESTSEKRKFLTHNNKIGIRISSSQLIDQLVHSVDFPITATSANISGQPDCTNVMELFTQFGENVSLYIDGGLLEGDASTVVDLSTDEIVMLREGAVKLEQLKEYWI